MVYKSNLTVFREAVALAERTGAPAEVVANLMRAHIKELERELAVTDRALSHVRGLLLEACAAAGVHRISELTPAIKQAIDHVAQLTKPTEVAR